MAPRGDRGKLITGSQTAGNGSSAGGMKGGQMSGEEGQKASEVGNTGNTSRRTRATGSFPLGKTAGKKAQSHSGGNWDAACEPSGAEKKGSPTSNRTTENRGSEPIRRLGGEGKKKVEVKRKG